MTNLFNYYQLKDRPCRYSDLIRSKAAKESGLKNLIKQWKTTNNSLVNIISYCLMPTHYHFIIEQVSDNGISQFIGNIQNAYTKHFNKMHKRSGPLWQGPFKTTHMTDDYILSHVSRYIHLNPTTARLCSKPHEWKFSSYKEFINSNKDKITTQRNYIEMDNEQYIKFCNNHIDYQRTIASLKNYLID